MLRYYSYCLTFLLYSALWGIFRVTRKVAALCIRGFRGNFYISFSLIGFDFNVELMKLWGD